MPRFLIIRFSSIGDIVLTTPVVRCLSEQVPGAEIHFLTKRSFASTVSENPRISKVYSIEKKAGEVIAQLKAENYDYVIDLHNNLRSLQVKTALGRPALTFSKLNFKKWLLVRFKKNLLPAVHIVDRYLEPLKKLGVKNDHKGLEFYISKKNEVALEALPLSHRNGYAGVVIGAAHFTKRLPADQLADICSRLELPVLLLGGPEDKATGDYIAAKAGEKVLNACGMYNLQQSASLVRQAKKILSHDTGLMHIAAAFKKDIVSVWGNTVPEFGMYPYYPEGSESKSIIQEIKGLSCRPCSKIGYDACPLGHFDCMRLQNAASIAAAVNS